MPASKSSVTISSASSCFCSERQRSPIRSPSSADRLFPTASTPSLRATRSFISGNETDTEPPRIHKSLGNRGWYVLAPAFDGGNRAVIGEKTRPRLVPDQLNDHPLAMIGIRLNTPAAGVVATVVILI